MTASRSSVLCWQSALLPAFSLSGPAVAASPPVCLLLFSGHTLNDTQDVIMHVTLIAGAIPLLCALFCLVWFGCGCFVCLVVFVFFCFLFLDGTAHWTA